MRLEGKVAIVTGGGVGIRRSACQLLARERAKVTVTDVNENDAVQAVEDIRRAGGTAEYWHLDVTREIQLKNTFAEIEAELERIDVLVNNAGIRASFRELKGRAGGREVSRSGEDRWLMDFLRAHHDGQLIAATTLREEQWSDARGEDYGIDDEQRRVYREEAGHWK